MKLKPTDPLQTTVAMLPEEDSTCMVSLVTLDIPIKNMVSPGKNTIALLELKYISSCAYSESVTQ